MFQVFIKRYFYFQQNNTAEVNQTGDGFFPSIFNEDDLQLMDMAITDSNSIGIELKLKIELGSNVSLFLFSL
jgi:hypothetical protein